MLLNITYDAPDCATAGYKERLYGEFVKAIKLVHKREKRREKRRIAVFKMQALARGYVVRTAQRAANAARCAAVAIALGDVIVARGGVMTRFGFQVPNEVQALIVKYVPVEPDVMFKTTSVLAGSRCNAISVY